MQSSSKLFPVALVSAENRGDLSEDVYRLKPGNSPDRSVEIALTRLGNAGFANTSGIPVVLLHGSFSNRRFWYSPKCIGLGPYLARAGFDVWIAEMRGHGLSPRNQSYQSNCVGDYARYDLPAISDFIYEQNARPAHWIGHSLGGTTLAAALGGSYMEPSQIASVALCGSQVSRNYWLLKVPPVQWVGRFVLKRFEVLSGSRLKRGPEDEPIGLAIEALRWHGLFGRFGDAERNWWQGLSSVSLPVLAVAGAGDKQDPPWACRKLLEQFGSSAREFIQLSKADGYATDYGHIEMLVSKTAQQEVWPLLRNWITQCQA
ncbi:Esterase/lipase/thioesterase family protein [Pseudomonas marincola]|uniref:EstX protein n=1 Tax=Pseudomonas marincola TaxID=437900 RepID=A0A653EB33_9PSED|nr:alpha/beta fold hydrolase [Pseudomonas marincola]CAE6922699.1 Esterase/lipase/thioesterase family protein [Pseudomonas marincola]